MSSPMRIVPPATAETLRNKTQNIRKIAVGEIDKTKPFGHGKVLMLLGATGAGKSTLINGFVNYIREVKYEDQYRYKLISNETSETQAKSQTKWITAYTFPKKDNSSRLPYTLTIIDTPGYGDTGGIQRDKEITKQIKDFFSIKGPHGIDHIDGIGFVVQASLPRLTPTQKYIFNSILSIFGKDIAKNIFLMITFADGNAPPVLSAIEGERIEYKNAFKFNSALFPAEGDLSGKDYQCNADFNKLFWKLGEKSFERFLECFGEVESVRRLQLTKELLAETERLQCLVEGLQQQVQEGLFKVDQLNQEKVVLSIFEKEIETNKEFEYVIEETRQRKIDLETGKHVTNCLKCHFTCHYPCYISKDEDKMNCAAMVNHTNCGVCSNRCYWNVHHNNPYRFELYTVKVKKTSQELKKRYEVARGNKTEKERIMSGLSKDLKSMQVGIVCNVRNVKRVIGRLDEIALRPNPLSEVQYIDVLIESEKMDPKEGWTRRVEALTEVRKEAVVLSTVKDEDMMKLIKKRKGADSGIWGYLKRSLSFATSGM